MVRQESDSALVCPKRMKSPRSIKAREYFSTPLQKNTKLLISPPQ
jgi:hypothetical protein